MQQLQEVAMYAETELLAESGRTPSPWIPIPDPGQGEPIWPLLAYDINDAAMHFEASPCVGTNNGGFPYFEPATYH